MAQRKTSVAVFGVLSLVAAALVSLSLSDGGTSRAQTMQTVCNARPVEFAAYGNFLQAVDWACPGGGPTAAVASLALTR